MPEPLDHKEEEFKVELVPEIVIKEETNTEQSIKTEAEEQNRKSDKAGVYSVHFGHFYSGPPTPLEIFFPRKDARNLSRFIYFPAPSFFSPE